MNASCLQMSFCLPTRWRMQLRQIPAKCGPSLLLRDGPHCIMIFYAEIKSVLPFTARLFAPHCFRQHQRRECGHRNGNEQWGGIVPCQRVLRIPGSRLSGSCLLRIVWYRGRCIRYITRGNCNRWLLRIVRLCGFRRDRSCCRFLRLCRIRAGFRHIRRFLFDREGINPLRAV